MEINMTIGGNKLYRFIKRTFDIFCSILALILSSPIFLIVAIAIKLDSKGPIIYSQYRNGKDNKLFKMYKFRSMYVDAEERLKDLQKFNEACYPAFKMKNDPRVTKVGKFIRKFSIDEMPQFVNILLGHMSFVGPRPPLPNEVETYTPYQMQRLLVRPGLTCYWQCMSNRLHVSFDEWVDSDLSYIKNRSIYIDFKILLMTIPAALGIDLKYKESDDTILLLDK